MAMDAIERVDNTFLWSHWRDSCFKETNLHEVGQPRWVEGRRGTWARAYPRAKNSVCWEEWARARDWMHRPDRKSGDWRKVVRHRLQEAGGNLSEESTQVQAELLTPLYRYFFLR